MLHTFTNERSCFWYIYHNPDKLKLPSVLVPINKWKVHSQGRSSLRRQNTSNERPKRSTANDTPVWEGEARQNNTLSNSKDPQVWQDKTQEMNTLNITQP